MRASRGRERRDGGMGRRSKGSERSGYEKDWNEKRGER